MTNLLLLNESQGASLNSTVRRLYLHGNKSAPRVMADTSGARYDDNGNGMITCAEARRHGIAPVSRSHPAYRYMRDGDGDGVVCE